MLSQKLKDLYNALVYPPSKVLRLLYLAHFLVFYRRPPKVHIRRGDIYLNGFINIDSSFQQRVDYLLDVRAGLPFPANSVELIYSSNMLEHLYVLETIDILKECRRVLLPGKYMRLTLPDFNHIHSILSGQTQDHFPRKLSSKTGMAINFLFRDGRHKYAYTQESLEELCRTVGFSKMVTAEANKDANISTSELGEPLGCFSMNLFK